MTTLTNTAKHTAALAKNQKPSTGTVFFGWLFYFTYPNFSVRLTNTLKHTAAVTNVPKH